MSQGKHGSCEHSILTGFFAVSRTIKAFSCPVITETGIFFHRILLLSLVLEVIIISHDITDLNVMWTRAGAFTTSETAVEVPKLMTVEINKGGLFLSE